MLMYCTNTFLTRAKKLRSCRKKYCASCLSKYVGPTGTLPTESTFICASCQGVCVCAACKRKLTDSLKTSLKKENRAKGKKKTSAKSRKNISHKYTDKDEGATSSCWNQTHDEASPIHHTIKAVMSNVDDISAGDVHSTNTNFSSPTDTLPGNAHSAAVDPRTAGAYSLMGDMVFVDDTALLTGTDSATAPKSALNYNSLGGAIVNTHSNTSIGRHLTLLPADNRDQGVAGKRKVSETEKRRGGQHKSRRKSSSVTLKKKDSGKKSKQIGVNGQKQSNRKQESSIETGSSTRDMAVLEQVRDRDKTLQSGYSGRSFHYSSRAHTMSMGANHMKYDMESSVKDKITSVTDDCRDMDGQHTSIASNVCLTNSLLPSHSSVQSSYYTAELENEKAISHPITVNSNSSKNRRNEDAHSRMTFLPNSCRQYYGDYIGDVQDPFTSSSSSSSSLRPPSPMFTSPTASSNPLPLSGPSRSLVTSHADGTSNDKHSSVFLSSSLPDGEDSRYFTPPAYSSASAPPSFPLHHSSSQLHPFSHRSSSADYFLDSGVQQRYEDREQPDSKPWHRSQAQTYLYARYQAKTSQLGSKPLPGDIIPRDGATSIKTTGQRPSSPKSVHSYPHDRQQMMRAMMDNDSNRGDPDTFIYGSSRSRHNSHCHHTSASEVEALRGVVPDPYIEGNNSNNSSRNSFSDQSFNRDPTRNYSRNLWSSTDRHKGTNVSSKAEEESGEDFMNFMVNSDEEALDGDENDGVTHETSERRDEKQRKEGDGQSSREAGCMSSYIPVPSVYRSMNKRCVGGGNTHYNDNSGFRGRSGKVGDTGGHTSVSCSRDDPNVDAYKLSDNSIWTSSKCTPQSVPLYPVTTLSARASLLGSDTQSEPSSSMRCASIDREHSAVRLFSASHSSVHSSPKAAVSSSPIAFQFPSVRYQCSQSLRNLIMKKQHGRQYSKSSSREIRRKDDFRSESGRICRSMSNSSNSSMQNDDIDSRSVISMRSMRSTSSHSTVGATALSGLRLYSPLQRAQTLRSGIHGSSRASTSSTNSSNSDVIYNFASDVDTSTSSNVNTMDGPGDYVSSDSECTRADANSKANAYLLEVLKTRWNSLKSHNLHQLRNMTPRSTAQISPSSPQPSPYTAASFSSSLLPTSCGAGTAQAFSSPSVQTQSAGSVSTSYTNFKANRSTKSFDQSSEGIAPFDDPLCRKSPRQTGASGVGEETVTPADAQMKAVENIVKSYSIGAISSMFECGLLSSNQRLGPQLLPPAPGGANAETDVNSTSSAGHIQTTNVNAFANITQGETNSAFALQNHIGGKLP